MKHSKKPAKRDTPDLPADLGDGVIEDQINEKQIHDVSRAHVKLGEFRIDASIFERVQLSDSEFGSATWKDVRLIHCDLANIRAHRIALVRVELIDCRLTGLRATAIDWQDVLVQNGDLRFAQLQSGKFKNCEFLNCNLEDADLQGSDLQGAKFQSCNLNRADFQRTKLQNADFRHSQVEGMVVGMNDVRGAIVDPAQAMIFARLLGLQIS